MCDFTIFSISHTLRILALQGVLLFWGVGFGETQVDSELFKDHSAYVRRALVASSAIFKDLGDKRKPEFLVNFILDAINRA